MLLISNCDGPSCGDYNLENSFRVVQLGLFFNTLVHRSCWCSIIAFLIEQCARVLISGKIKDAENNYLKKEC